jgi:hypothetical protein
VKKETPIKEKSVKEEDDDAGGLPELEDILRNAGMKM